MSDKTPKWWRPSALPALSVCPRYRSAPGGEAANHGTLMHQAVEARLSSANPNIPTEIESGLTADDEEQIQWAVDWVRLNVERVHLEYPLATSVGGHTLAGTADVVGFDGDRPVVVDYKFGDERNYVEQMLAYALAWMEECEALTCHVVLLYPRHRHAEPIEVAKTYARSALEDVARRAFDPEAAPHACDYCSWCKGCATCPETHKAMVAVARRADSALAIPDPSELTDPAQAAALLNVIKAQVEPYCRAVRKRATEMAQSGAEIPGWTLKSRKGARELRPSMEVAKALGLSPAELLAACQIKISDAEAAVAAKHELTKTAAKRRVSEDTAPFVTRGEPSEFLAPAKH